VHIVGKNDFLRLYYCFFIGSGKCFVMVNIGIGGEVKQRSYHRPPEN